MNKIVIGQCYNIHIKIL